jgi:TetR/AcrR family transcriptional regulator, cholesterol catabolism regulator
MVPPDRALSRKQAIISRAAELFDAAGYSNVNMTEVAQTVGLAKPTLYHYFSGKDEILFGIHEEFINQLVSRYETRRGQGLTASDELRALIGDTFELMDTHRGHLRVFFESQRELTEKDMVTIRAKRDRYSEIMKSTIERAIADGEVRDVDPELTALAIFGMCNWAYQWYDRDGPFASAQIADFFFDLIFRGLAPRQTTS